MIILVIMIILIILRPNRLPTHVPISACVQTLEIFFQMPLGYPPTLESLCALNARVFTVKWAYISPKFNH